MTLDLILLNASGNGFGERCSIYEKIKKGTLHIWMNSHIFPKHYNSHKISIDNGQVCWTNPDKKFKFYVI